MLEEINSFSSEIASDIIEIRRCFHRNPELSFEEFETTKRIISFLEARGIDYECIAPTAVVATVKGKNNGKTLALRADIDALPILENNVSSYTSVNNGVMHACGHDAHAAMMLGVAHVINMMRDSFNGTIKLLFQPGEEKLPGGATIMINNNVLENVDAIIAQHVYPDLPCGKVGFCSGEYMASCDEINITVKGKGGHAAKISERQNTTVAAAQILCKISELSDEFSVRKNDTPVAIAFGSFIADGTYNVIPDIVNLKGTMRTFNEDVRKDLKNKIAEICAEISSSFKVNADLFIEEGYPVLINDKDLTDSLKNNAEIFLGNDNVETIPQLMTAEDFAWYSHKVKACMYRIGTSNVDKGIVSKQHTPTFDIDEEALLLGVRLMSYLAIKFLNDNE